LIIFKYFQLRAFDKNIVREFTVMSNMDLNSFPALRQAQGVSALKEVGFLCCQSGTILGSFAIPKSIHFDNLE